MKIAFYAPMKPPGHPVPSGDRQMARHLVEAMRLSGHDVRVVSSLRVFLNDPGPEALAAAIEQAKAERDRIAEEWRAQGAAELWFTYHPFYKSPDLLGPDLCEATGIPYVTAESSLSRRRDQGAWRETQALVAKSVAMARMNLCFTERDHAGLRAAVPHGRFERLAPFIDTASYESIAAADAPARLVAVAMMRPGDKFESFRMLAAALAGIVDLPWRLTVVGGGKSRKDVEDLFASIPPERVEWLGEVETGRVPEILLGGGIYVWPGFGEAYGLSYLEAQAAGMPVVAQKIAGVPEVVLEGKTGLLTPEGNVRAFSEAIRRLLTSEPERAAMGAAARRFVLGERSLKVAARRIDDLLSEIAGAACS